MNNKKPIFILVCSFLILFSCNYKSRNAEQSSTDNKLSECKLDTSINEFSLMNPVSLDSILSKIRFDSKYIQYDSINLLYNKYFFRNDTLRKIEIGYDW